VIQVSIQNDSRRNRRHANQGGEGRDMEKAVLSRAVMWHLEHRILCYGNMTVVFDAVALNNPYPAAFLAEPAWNQMVLKGIFMSRPLYRMFRLEERRNDTLARMVSDFSHERWAASRKVTPEVWRLTAPFLAAHQVLRDDISTALQSADTLHQEAAVLALHECGAVAGLAVPSFLSPLQRSAAEGALSWASIAERWYAQIS